MPTTIAEFMEQDHDRLDEIFKEFQATKRQNAEKTKTLFQEFLRGLQRHIVWEEEILFPVFEAHANMGHDHGPTAVMRNEHRQINMFLEQILEKVTAEDPTSDEAEQGLLTVLTAHNIKEEKILYPWIDNSVSENERASLRTQMQNLPPETYDHRCQ